MATGVPSHAIIDLNLPDGTGVDVLADLRTRGMPTHVLIVSAAAADGRLVAAARALGVDAVLTKPPD